MTFVSYHWLKLFVILRFNETEYYSQYIIAYHKKYIGVVLKGSSFKWELLIEIY